MIVGQPKDFAIEWEVVRSVDNWVFGHFRFWTQGEAIGDWDDLVDLKGCRKWLHSFVTTPQNRFELEICNLSKEVIFNLLFDSIMPVIAGSQTNLNPPIENIETRFHISYVGMSSFDHFDILLLETLDWQRLLWRNAHDMLIKEIYLPPQQIQKVAEQFCLEFLPDKNLNLGRNV